MESKRRRGKADSKTRMMIMDVAEEIMVKNGYASVTSRKVAAKADVSYQLVHYYFRSMDDLFVAILDRSTDLYKKELRKISKSARPLTGLWKMNSMTRRSALSVQFMALATHNERVRSALKNFGDYFRARQIEIIEQHFSKRQSLPCGLSPEVLAVTIENIARMMVFGNTLDLSLGHEQTCRFVEQYLRALEEARCAP